LHVREMQEGFITRSFLRSVWALDYDAFKDSSDELALVDRLKRWSARTDLKETSAESALLEEFFVKTWGYVQPGQSGSEHAFTLYPKFSVPGAGANGGASEADAALGMGKPSCLALIGASPGFPPQREAGCPAKALAKQG
jgi:hypothetical protein